jgi:formylglycine-generating enzyme required for sulfatase activity
MGETDRDRNASNEEKPQHKVTISRSFYIGRYPVTQNQWFKVISSKPKYLEFDDEKAPVENVSWFEVKELIDQLNRREEYSEYRLPTEAEWEYSARAGTGGIFSFGNDSSQLRNHGWFDGNSRGKTHRVGEFPSNSWGLYDVQGNVYEWCEDWYDETYYSKSPSMDPLGPMNGEERVIRGGSWNSREGQCRLSKRDSLIPYLRNSKTGFRLVYLASFLD